LYKTYFNLHWYNVDMHLTFTLAFFSTLNYISMKAFYINEKERTGIPPALFHLLAVFCCAFLTSHSIRAQQIEWDKTFGGDWRETIAEIKQTSDGGYILGGSSWSGVSGDKSEESRGESDYWIVKLDAGGNKIWDRTFGGADTDILTTIHQTTDGGYIVGGTSWSGSGGDKTHANMGDTDFWVLKLDADGNKLWDRTYGGDNRDFLYALLPTADGGYLLGGTSNSGIGGDKTQASLSFDYWLIKIDASGNKIWDRTYGGAGRGYDGLHAIVATSDGGYLLGGSSDSGAGRDKSEPNKSGCKVDDLECSTDFWLVKIDAEGVKQWDKTVGGFRSEFLHGLVQTADGGYLAGGYSFSNISGDKTENNRGQCDSDETDVCSPDYWVVKLDAAGNVLWDKTLGGSKHDYLRDLIETPNGYLLGGYSNSPVSGEKTEGDPAYCDDEDEYFCSAAFWIVKLDFNGTKLWDKVYEGSGWDMLQSMQLTADGGYILGGESTSRISGDKSEDLRGIIDYWIIKLSPEDACTPPTPSITIVPTSDVYTGGDPATVYLGYGPQSVQLVASGGATYSWSPATGLSSTTIADPVFTPTAPGSYTFTVTAYDGACSATATVTITVIDVRCGNGKVRLCHKGQELCIAPAAVASHLRQHAGDRLGNCHKGVGMPMALRVHPNPFSGQSQVEFSLAAADTYRLELYNAGGKMLGVVAEGRAQPGQVVSLELRGEKLREGMYYLRLITRDEVQTTRLVLKK
jgi:hypothetical protein